MKLDLMKKYKLEMMLLKVAKHVFLIGTFVFLYIKYVYSGFLTQKLADYGIIIKGSPTVFWAFMVVLGVIISFLLYFYFRAKKLTVHKAVIPHYDLHEKLHPSLVGAVIDGSFDSSDFDAGIVDLVINGLMTIEEKEIDGEIFQIWRQIPRDKIDYEKLYKFKLRKLFYERLFKFGIEERGDENNPPVFSIKEEQQGWFIRNNRDDHISFVYSDIENYISNTKYFRESNLFIGLKVLFGIMMITAGTLILGVSANGHKRGDLMLFKVIGAALFLIIVGIFMYKQRNKEGYKLAHYLKGYYDFLATTDLHELSMKKGSGFERHFPYAVAFGLIDMFDGDLVEKSSKTSSDAVKPVSSKEVESYNEEMKDRQIKESWDDFMVILFYFVLALGSVLLSIFNNYN